jgi:hypothetical protein
MHERKTLRALTAAVLALGVALPDRALDKPTGAPLVLSSVETEQPIPLALLPPDGKTPACVMVRLHWAPLQKLGPDDDSTSFTLDVPAESPGASMFLSQLWSASLASALAWQQPWQGARWKILDTPATDGTGISAALAVGMIATSARRPYPKTTLVIGNLKPDGSLGAVSRLADRLNAAAGAGITRVIIPSVQRFDIDDSGQVLNMMRRATDLGIDCVPVDNLVEATEAVMNDPLPDVTVNPTPPKYSDDVAGYIGDFARREQDEAASGISYAPAEAQLDKYPPSVAAIWKSIYADRESAQAAFRAGQVYVAYRLFERINGRMRGANALTGDDRNLFDVQTALSNADTLRQRLHYLMNPPPIDRGELESALLVSEMADWAYDISAELEGAQLVTKQAYSQRTDATQAEKDRAREAILFANADAEYMLNGADFFTGLISHVDAHPIPVDENAAHLLPQLIPAQLATAEIFSQGIRPRANEMRDGLLFDRRLVAYINVLRDTKAAWDARQRKKELDAAVPSTGATGDTTKLDSASTANVGFDPGNTYAPPHAVIVSSASGKKLSDAAACLIWVDNDCEIATLDEKYLRLDGTIDPKTHEWHLKDRAQLDALLQSAESGARVGISFAEKAEVDTSVLALIYERAAQLRLEGDDMEALSALRNYWRCALLGNMCWQLAHARKAEPVDLAATDAKKGDKTSKSDKKADDKTANESSKDKNTDKVATGDESDKSTDKSTDQNKPAETPQAPPADAPVVAAPTAASAPSSSAATSPTPTPATTPATSADTADNNSPRALPVIDDTVSPTNSAPTAPAPVATPAQAAPPTPAPAPVAGPVVMPGAVPATAPEATPATAPSVAVSPSPVVVPTPAPTPASTPAQAAPVAPAVTTDPANIPVAPIARTEDYSGGDTNAAPISPPASTNAAPVTGPIPPGQPFP